MKCSHIEKKDILHHLWVNFTVGYSMYTLFLAVNKFYMKTNIINIFFLDGDVDEFHTTLRMSPNTYNSLLELLRPGLTKKTQI